MRAELLGVQKGMDGFKDDMVKSMTSLVKKNEQKLSKK